MLVVLVCFFLRLHHGVSAPINLYFGMRAIMNASLLLFIINVDLGVLM